MIPVGVRKGACCWIPERQTLKSGLTSAQSIWDPGIAVVKERSSWKWNQRCIDITISERAESSSTKTGSQREGLMLTN